MRETCICDPHLRTVEFPELIPALSISISSNLSNVGKSNFKAIVLVGPPATGKILLVVVRGVSDLAWLRVVRPPIQHAETIEVELHAIGIEQITAFVFLVLVKEKMEDSTIVLVHTSAIDPSGGFDTTRVGPSGWLGKGKRRYVASRDHFQKQFVGTNTPRILDESILHTIENHIDQPAGVSQLFFEAVYITILPGITGSKIGSKEGCTDVLQNAGFKNPFFDHIGKLQIIPL